MHVPQVASSFPWTPGASLFAHPLAVHNSVLGVRGEALAAGAGVQLVDVGVGVDGRSEESTHHHETEPLGDPHAGGGRKDVAGTAAGAGARCTGKPWRVTAAGSAVWGCGGGSSSGSGVTVGSSVGSSSSAAVQGRGGSAAGGGGAGGGSAPPLHLLALPAECNFTGDRLPLERLVASVRERGVVGAGGAAVGTCGTAAVLGAAAHGQQQRRGRGGAEGAAGPSRMGATDGNVQSQQQQQQEVGEETAPAEESTSSSAAAHVAHGRWLVLLDAAKACSTHPPDLTAVRADFVVLSYYKIFGHPTGLGALVVRRDALELLAGGKRYFGGGTVEVAVADRPYHVRYGGCAVLYGRERNCGEVDGPLAQNCIMALCWPCVLESLTSSMAVGCPLPHGPHAYR